MTASTNLMLLRQLREKTERLARLELGEIDRQIKAIERSERPAALQSTGRHAGPGSAKTKELATLREMQRVGEPLRAVELMRLVGASRPTVARWLTSLVRQGYVEHVGTRYRVVKEVPQL